MEENKARPFLKWAGGKKAVLPELLRYIPEKYNRYFEPFLGSGALFFGLSPKEAFLSDLNRELVNAYQQIKRNVDEIIELLKSMNYGKKFYYQLRSEIPKDTLSRAARFIYLNRTCWNGLYRVNAEGKFNVPFGRYTNPTICDEENLRLASNRLNNANIVISDFRDAIQETSRDDLIYFDPPYTTSHKNNGFIEYNSKIFSLRDQYGLVETMKKLDKKGCKVIVSNADHRTMRKYYNKFNIHVITRKSLIAAKKENRKDITELIITNF